MKNEQCVRFLQWALPELRMRWPGFRKVRNQVCSRIKRRIRDLGLSSIAEYQALLESEPAEWQLLDSFCRITISRFYRDKGVFAVLEEIVIPELAQVSLERGTAFRILSIGCGSGEEPYTVAMLWELELKARFPSIEIEIVATDADPNVLQRAANARYSHGSLKDLPERWRNVAFAREGDDYRLSTAIKRLVTFMEQDIREVLPEGPFDLVLCRNLVFTYFDEALQLEVLSRILNIMRPGAALVTGIHEKLPDDAAGFFTWFDKERIFRKDRRAHAR